MAHLHMGHIGQSFHIHMGYVMRTTALRVTRGPCMHAMRGAADQSQGQHSGTAKRSCVLCRPPIEHSRDTNSSASRACSAPKACHRGVMLLRILTSISTQILAPTQPVALATWFTLEWSRSASSRMWAPWGGGKGVRLS